MSNDPKEPSRSFRIIGSYSRHNCVALGKAALKLESSLLGQETGQLKPSVFRDVCWDDLPLLVDLSLVIEDILK